MYTFKVICRGWFAPKSEEVPTLKVPTLEVPTLKVPTLDFNTYRM